MNLYTTSDALAQVTENGIGLGSIFNKLKIDIDSYEEIIRRFSELKLNRPEFKLDDDKANWDAIAKAIEGCDETSLSYFKALDDGNGTINNQSASVEGLGAHLKATGQSFNFAAFKATLLNTALNAGIFLVASVAIQGIAKALDNYIHRVEKARERSDELFDEFKSMNDTLADHRKTVSELAARYDELSKGVNLSTNDNVSLSTEEYEEFLDINEQLAQSFPELAKGVDENGNSILTLGTKGITAKEELEELLQTEEDLNNFRIAQEIGDAFKGVYTYVEEANEATEKLNSTITDSSEAMNKLQDVAENGIKLTGENGQLIFAGNTNNQAELVYMNSLTASANEFWKSLDGNRRVELDTLGINAANLFSFNQDEYTGAFEVYSQAFSLTPEELTALENIIQDNVGDASGALLDSISDKSQELQGQVQQGENAWRDFIPNLVSGMKSKQTFKDLDSDLQDIAVQIVEGLDYSYATAMREWNPNDPYAYIRDNLIVPMGNLNNDDKQIVTDSFTKLMTLDAKDITDSNREAITDLIAKIADILEKDELEIRVALGFDVGDDAKKRLQHSIRQITDDRGLADRKQVSELNEYTKDFTLSQVELWLEATKGAENATQAIEMYEAALLDTNNMESDDTPVSLSISDTIDKLNTQLKPAFDSLHSAYQNIFTDGKSGLNSIDILSTCDSIKSKLNEYFT